MFGNRYIGRLCDEVKGDYGTVPNGPEEPQKFWMGYVRKDVNFRKGLGRKNSIDFELPGAGLSAAPNVPGIKTRGNAAKAL
jgi:hypothetical protein